MSVRQEAALVEVEHAARSLLHDLFLMALSLDVILAECRDEGDCTVLDRYAKGEAGR
jgi:hypothetical protein